MGPTWPSGEKSEEGMHTATGRAGSWIRRVGNHGPGQTAVREGCLHLPCGSWERLHSEICIQAVTALFCSICWLCSSSQCIPHLPQSLYPSKMTAEVIGTKYQGLPRQILFTCCLCTYIWKPSCLALYLNDFILAFGSFLPATCSESENLFHHLHI